MDRIHITAQKRIIGSKSYLKKLRKSGKVPAVLHGHDCSSFPLILNAGDLKKAISTSAGLNALLELEIEGQETQTTMIEKLYRDILNENIFLHVDLIRVALDQKTHVHVPIMLVGHEKRVNDGGIISQAVHEVLVQSIPTKIPEHISVDISKMAIGDTLSLKEVELPEGCEALTPLDDVLVSILHPRGAAEEAEPAAEVAETEETVYSGEETPQ